MKTNKSKKLIVAGIIGCGICCLPLILPLAAGLMGVSILGFTLTGILCGIFLVLTMALAGTYYLKRKNSGVTSTCE